MQKIVVFGAGLVARAHVRYLLDHGYLVTVATRTVAKADAIIGGHTNGRPLAFDIDREPERLGEIVAAHDLAVSLLPWSYHPQVARACLDNNTHMVTTSYVKPAMQVLDAEARGKGLILLNELGVDPGIDHMTAMQIIERVRAEGGEIVSFTSFCGGLPAPEANDNPFGYKFSWSPRGVILAGKNPALFRRDGTMVNVPGERLFDYRWKVPVVIEGKTYELEGYPNRDSMPYEGYYGIQPPDTMFRGTLRFPYWCDALQKLIQLGMVDETKRDDLAGMTWASLMARLAGADGTADAKGAVASRLGLADDSPQLGAYQWLGLFDDEPLPAAPPTTVDMLTARMLQRMRLKEGERDLLVLQHTFIATYPDRKERITSTMIDFGIPGGDTSMNRTVGLPAAIGVRLILEGKVAARGVVVPVLPEIYDPAVEELQRLGIQFTETTERI